MLVLFEHCNLRICKHAVGGPAVYKKSCIFRTRCFPLSSCDRRGIGPDFLHPMFTSQSLWVWTGGSIQEDPRLRSRVRLSLLEPQQGKGSYTQSGHELLAVFLSMTPR